MHKRITFRNVEKSDAIEQYANQQLAKIEEFLKNERSPIYIDLIIEPSKTREHHKIELRVKSPNYEAYSEYEHKGVDFHDVLNRVIEVMYLNLHEQKKRHVTDKKVIARADEFKKER